MINKWETTDNAIDQTAVLTSNQESPFKYEELFFSVTDTKSKILFANEVFVRISGYETEELIGQLHKKIRHPEMPRSVFKIFWDHLENGAPVAAYVKNRAKNGSYYWVMALAYPCSEGFLSIRLKPGSPLFETTKNIYRDVLTYEKKQEAEWGKRKGMYHAEEYLMELLKQHGYDSYDDFMWKALASEMRNREMEVDTRQILADLKEGGISAELIELQVLLGELFSSLKGLEKLHEVLINNSNYMLELARSIFRLSLNTQVGASKLSDDLAISTIAQNIGKQSQQGERELNKIQEIVTGLNGLLNELNFDIISSKLQVEMSNTFLLELSKEEISASNNAIQLIDILTAKELLVSGYESRMNVIIDDINELPKHLRMLRNQIIHIERFLHVMRYIRTTGKMEVARMGNQANMFAATFEDLMREVSDAKEKLDELSEIIHENEQTIQSYSHIKKRLTFMARNSARINIANESKNKKEVAIAV